jgi:hypothetical protein
VPSSISVGSGLVSESEVSSDDEELGAAEKDSGWDSEWARW